MTSDVEPGRASLGGLPIVGHAAQIGQCIVRGCHLNADVHMRTSLERADGLGELIQACASHAIVLNRQLGSRIVQAHVWRDSGSACGVDGTVWLHYANTCVPDPDLADPNGWHAELRRYEAAGGES